MGQDKFILSTEARKKEWSLAALIRSRTKSDSAYIPWTRNIVIPEDTDILINGTSIGFSPNVTEKPDVDYTSIRPNMCVCDVIFNPCDTLFLKAAQKNGAKNRKRPWHAGAASRPQLHPLDRRGSSCGSYGRGAEERILRRL